VTIGCAGCSLFSWSSCPFAIDSPDPPSKLAQRFGKRHPLVYELTHNLCLAQGCNDLVGPVHDLAFVLAFFKLLPDAFFKAVNIVFFRQLFKIFRVHGHTSVVENDSIVSYFAGWIQGFVAYSLPCRHDHDC
jgi:hypothetical protein